MQDLYTLYNLMICGPGTLSGTWVHLNAKSTHQLNNPIDEFYKYKNTYIL